MLNIISNTNTTITAIVSTDKALLERKVFSLSREEASNLYKQLQDARSEDWKETDSVKAIIDKLETDIFDDVCNFNLEIRFDDVFISSVGRGG